MTYIGAVRLARFAYSLRRFGGIAQVIKNINRIVYSCDIPYQVYIPKSTNLPHQGLGLVMHPKTVIGENCTIFQHVTFGSSHGEVYTDAAPNVGNNVLIGCGAVLLGGIHIGNNVIIGANSVVLKDIPDYAVVAGIPAVIKKYKEKLV